MTFIITSVLSFLLAYRYFSLFVITFFAAFIFPLPSNLSVLTAASFTNQGVFNIYFVIGIALLGNIAGDLLMYGLAYRYGKRTLEKISIFKRFFNSPKYDYYTDKVNRYAPITIIISRFVTEANPIVNIICGIVPVPFFQYLKFELIGEVLDVLVFALAGFFLGSQGLTVLQTTELLLLAAASMWIIIQVVRKVMAIRKG